MKSSVAAGCFLLALLSTAGHAQFMEGTSAEGVSSLIGGKTIGFNVARTSLRFDYTGKFQKRSVEENNRSGGFTNWGTSLAGGNNENVAQLVKNGTFVPSASASAFLFRGWTIGREKSAALLDPLKSIEERLTVLDAKFFKDTLQPETARLIRRLTDPVKTTVQKAVDLQGDNIGGLIADLNDFAKEPTTTDKEKTELRNSVKVLRGLMANHRQFKERLALLESQKSVVEEYDNFLRLNPYKRVIVFGRAGLSATSFKFYDKLNATNFARSFRDTIFTAPFGELGVNLFTRSYLIFGLAAGFIRANTLQSGTPGTLTIESTSTDALGQTITTKRSITAYQGSYRQYGQGYVKGDMVVLLAASQRGTFALNPFFRYAYGSRAVIADQLTTGINGYFFNHQGKFLGGLYVQRTQNSPLLTGNGRAIEFGLRASYLLSTVFDTANPNP